MKLSKKIKVIAMPIAALSVVAAPIFTATSCSKNYETSFFKVTNNTGLEVEFCDYGASISNIKLGSTYITYHPQDRATFVDAEATPYYYGKILGRVAGRFKDGKVTGKNWQLQVNEKGATKNNCLHGGKDALSFKEFKHEVTEKTDTEGDYTEVKFTYTSPDGEAGFAGKLDVVAIYKVYKDKNWIDTELSATPDEETLINLSTHSLFRLGNDGDVLDYELTIPTDLRVEYDKESEMKTGQIPVGTKDVKNEDLGMYNFNKVADKTIKDCVYPSKVRDPISNGIDHIWYVGDNAVADRYVELYNPKNHLDFKVQALSEQVTGFILYSNDYPRAGQIMNDGKEDQIYAGITIEPYTYFTAEGDGTDPHKPGLKPITYKADQKFETKYRYIISQKQA